MPDPLLPPARVVVEDRGYRTPCWICTGPLNADGYKTVHVGGRKGVVTYAHRLGYEEAHGPIPAGMTVDHLCRQRACRRGSHLEAVSRGENARRGERTKITAAIAREIRRLRGGGARPVELAARFGLAPCTVSNICAGRVWRDA